MLMQLYGTAAPADQKLAAPAPAPAAPQPLPTRTPAGLRPGAQAEGKCMHALQHVTKGNLGA